MTRIPIVIIFVFFSLNSDAQFKKNNENKKEDTGFEKKEREKLKYNTIFFDALQQKSLKNYKLSLELFETCIRLNPNESAAYYEAARINQILHNTDIALEQSRVSIKKDPANNWYIKLYAELLKKNQEYQKAAIEYKKLIKKLPKNQEYYFLLAETYIHNREYLRAIGVYDQIEEFFGIDKMISMQKYSLYMQENKTNLAIKEVEKIIQHFPSDIEALEILSELYLLNNQQSKAIGIFQKLAKENPGNGHVNLKLANYYRDIGDKEKSFNELKKAFENPNLLIDIKIPVIASYFPLLDSDETMKKQAFELCGILVKKHATNHKSHALNGDLFYAINDHENALENYLKSIEIEENQPQVWTQSIFILADQGDFDKVLEFSKQALNLFPFNPIFYYFQGVSESRMKQHNNSVKTLTLGLDYVVNNDLLKVEYYSTLAESQRNLGKHHESDSLFELALSINPDNALILNNYSYYLSLRKKNLEKAKEMSKRSNELDPENGTYQDTYAWILYQMGDYKNSEMWLKKAITNGGNKSSVIVEHYGDVLFMLGKKDEALKQWKQASVLDKNNNELLKKIKTMKLND